MVKRLLTNKYKIAIRVLGVIFVVIAVPLALFFIPATKPLIVKLSEPLPFLNVGDVTTTCSLAPADATAPQVTAGDPIAFSCSITNSSKTDYKDLTLYTTLPRDTIHRIRDLQGVTGYSIENNTLIFKNISLAAKGKTTVRFVANANYSDKTYEVAITPEIRKNASLVARADQTKISIGKSTTPTMGQFVIKEGGQK